MSALFRFPLPGCIFSILSAFHASLCSEWVSRRHYVVGFAGFTLTFSLFWLAPLAHWHLKWLLSEWVNIYHVWYFSTCCPCCWFLSLSSVSAFCGFNWAFSRIPLSLLSQTWLHLFFCYVFGLPQHFRMQVSFWMTLCHFSGTSYKTFQIPASLLSWSLLIHKLKSLHSLLPLVFWTNY